MRDTVTLSEVAVPPYADVLYPPQPFRRVGDVVQQNEEFKREIERLQAELAEAAKTHALIETDLRRRLDSALSRMADAGVKLVNLQKVLARIHEVAERRKKIIQRLIAIINGTGGEKLRAKAMKSIGELIT